MYIQYFEISLFWDSSLYYDRKPVVATAITFSSSLFFKKKFSLFDIVILKFTQLLFHLFFCKKDPRLAWAMQKTRLMSWVEILGFFFLSLVKVSSGLQWLFY